MHRESLQRAVRIIISDPSNVRNYIILRDRFLFYTEKSAIFEVILSICSEF